MDRAERARALADFRTGKVRVLVMDSSGAVGLDLSFVQHVFLMEPLGDLSLEQQIISRAHRLGATHAVHAEVLVMKVLHVLLIYAHCAEEHCPNKRSISVSTAVHLATTYSSLIHDCRVPCTVINQACADTVRGSTVYRKTGGVGVQDSVEDDVVNISHGLRTQKLSDAGADSIITRCQRECWCAVLLLPLSHTIQFAFSVTKLGGFTQFLQAVAKIIFLLLDINTCVTCCCMGSITPQHQKPRTTSFHGCAGRKCGKEGK